MFHIWAGGNFARNCKMKRKVPTKQLELIKDQEFGSAWYDWTEDPRSTIMMAESDSYDFSSRYDESIEKKKRNNR